ncbi:MAG: hypothetical protein J6X53_10585, partial [Abditibacteriota bacterium]|nr:hypothetical protein [Abditibacteriota bacterium]
VTKLQNGYFSVLIDKGYIVDVQTDSSGKGNYGYTVATGIYPGLVADQGQREAVISGTSATIKNIDLSGVERIISHMEKRGNVGLKKGTVLSQEISFDSGLLTGIEMDIPTYITVGSGATLRLRKGSIDGPVVAARSIENIGDNSRELLACGALEPGTYFIEMSEPVGNVGWYLDSKTEGFHYENGKKTAGTFAYQLRVGETVKSEFKVTLKGNKMICSVPGGDCSWHMETIFPKDGYIISNPKFVPFYRFISDMGQYLPIAYFKRVSSTPLSFTAEEYFDAMGNDRDDFRFTTGTFTLDTKQLEDHMIMTLGKKFEMTVVPHSEKVPDYYPVFFTADKDFDKSMNDIFYSFAYAWPSLSGVSGDWYEWMSLIHFWHSRPFFLAHWKSLIGGARMTDEGSVYTWGNRLGWPFPDNDVYDTRHFVVNAFEISSFCRMWEWTRDDDFLKENIGRIEKAAEFLLKDLHGEDGLIVMPDKDHGGTKYDIASNYWDDLPFGGTSAYENIYFKVAMEHLAGAERYLGNNDKAAGYEAVVKRCMERFEKTFWDEKKGRYIGCIDKNGEVHDYGFTYVNMEALAYGFGDEAKAKRIYDWMENGVTASGKADTYTTFVFAPRANTEDVSDWWYMNGTGEIPRQQYGMHLENGGAILYTSGFDIIARCRYLGGDNAYKRLSEILDRFNEDDKLCGGSPLMHGEINGWQVGTDLPFPESGMVGASFIYGIMGMESRHDGIYFRPHVPTALRHAGVKNLTYGGKKYTINVTNRRVNITGSGVNKTVNIPPEGVLVKLR